MSGTSEDKLDPGKTHPLDLAKLPSVKTVDVKTPLIMAGQQTIRGMRVLTTAPGQGGTVTGSTIIMPSQVLKAAGHQITGIINTGKAGGTALPANITIQRPAQITLAASLPMVSAQTSPQMNATYHVPRGPAVVANLSAPRNSNVGANIRAPLVVRDGTVVSATGLNVVSQQSSNLVAATVPNVGVQQFSVRPTRTPSPAQNPAAVPSAVTSAWLTTVNALPNSAVVAAGNGNIQQQQQYQHASKSTVPQQQQLLTPIRSTSTSVSVSLGGTSIGSATITPAIVTPKCAAAVVPAGLVVTRTQPGQHQQTSVGGQLQAVNTTLATIRPTIFQPSSHLPLNSPLHQYKPGTASGQVGTTNIAGGASIAQVLPNRTQTLVYSGSGSVNQQQTQHSFTNAPRLAIGTTNTAFRQTSTPRSVVTATRLSMPSCAQTAQAGARVLTAPPGTTVVTSTGVRISAVSTISHQQQQNQPLATLGSPTIVNRGLSSYTSASSSSTLANVTALPTSLGGGATLTPAPPVSMAGPGGRLSVTVAPGSAATLSLANNAHGQQQQTQLIGAGGAGQGVRSHTLNLHSLPLVAVANTSPHHILSGPGGGPVKGIVHQSGAIHSTSSTIKAIQNITTTGARTIVNMKPAAIVTQRQTSVVTTQAIPIGKVYPQQGEPGLAQTNVYIHTTVPSAPKRASPGLLISDDFTGNSASASDSSVGGLVLPQLQPNSAFSMSQVSIPTLRPTIYTHNQINASATISQQQPAKLTSSPRPSILRKRDNDGSPLKAAKNLTTTLNSIQQQQVQHLLQQQHQQLQMPLELPRSPHIRPDSRNNGNSSEGGSTTISASSSPGLGDAHEDMVSMPINIIKGEEENRPPPEMSPRKKPRKQNLTGNDFDDNRHDDMQFLNDHRDVKKEHAPHQMQMDHHIPMSESDPTRASNATFLNSQSQQPFQLNQIKLEHDTTSQTQPLNQQQQQQQRSGGKMVTERVNRKPQASLLNSYRQTWKTTNNHYLRYSDVKPKDERRPSIMDLSNQYRVLDKVNGWKIHHLSTQMEDLADQEQAVYNQLTELLKYTESREWNSHDKDVNRINELIKGNLQRIKIINDGMVEAKAQIMKIFDHKSHVIDIISRCASKRNYKKREKV